MTDTLTQPPPDQLDREDEGIESSRMSFGDHLDELRGCLIRALLGVTLAAAVTLTFGKEILEIIFRPLWSVQVANGLQPNLQALAPMDAFTAYLKISFLSALIVSMPWVLHQGWRFVAVGLFARERQFVRAVVWASSGLFVVGVLFLYFLVLPTVLQFFIVFNREFGAADLAPLAVRSLSEAPIEAPVPADSDIPSHLRVLTEDPADSRPGEYWINATTRRLMFRPTGDREVWSIPFEIGAVSPALQSQFAVDQYVSFVLLLALAFGLTFETPIVVVFLAWSGLVAAATMAQSRRYIILGVILISAVLTPSADILNQMLLAGPMYILFELGLVFAKRVERRRTT